MDEQEIFNPRVDLSELHESVEKMRAEIGKVIVGQQEMIDLLLAALLADGHVLIEGVPGIAKTLTARLLAKTIATDFSRIQFTPDLMPSDILGTSVFNRKKSDFEFKKGPVFSNLVLIDEINRSPAKTQAALFEVMEERQVTIDGATYHMAPPFLVVATQNPIEQEGTYRLPEAQIDRFLFKIEMSYPSLEEETTLLNAAHERENRDETESVQTAITATQVVKFQQQVGALHIDENLILYIAQIVNQTRNHNGLYLGASPRASLAIMAGAKAFAAMSGRDFVTPEDVRRAVYPALRHRLLLTPEKEMEGVATEDIIKLLLESVEAPR